MPPLSGTKSHAGAHAPKSGPTLRVSFLETLAVGDTHSLSDPLHSLYSACRRETGWAGALRCSLRRQGCGGGGGARLEAKVCLTLASQHPPSSLSAPLGVEE
jgi:hypothetical protein